MRAPEATSYVYLTTDQILSSGPTQLEAVFLHLTF